MSNIATIVAEPATTNRTVTLTDLQQQREEMDKQIREQQEQEFKKLLPEYQEAWNKVEALTPKLKGLNPDFISAQDQWGGLGVQQIADKALKAKGPQTVDQLMPSFLISRERVEEKLIAQREKGTIGFEQGRYSYKPKQRKKKSDKSGE